MRPDVAEIVCMMNQHGRAARESVAVEVELFQLPEGEREQEMAFHPAVIDGGAGGVKGVRPASIPPQWIDPAVIPLKQP